MYDQTVLLVARCSELSDGAKVTLLELIPHFENGRIPTLGDLERTRGMARSTVQGHREELVQKGILIRLVNHEEKISWILDLKALTALCGFGRKDPQDIDLHAMVSQKPVSLNEDLARVQTIRAKGPEQLQGKDLLDLVKSLYREAYGEFMPVGRGADLPCMKEFLRRVGQEKAVETLTYMFEQRGKLKVDKLTPTNILVILARWRVKL